MIPIVGYSFCARGAATRRAGVEGGCSTNQRPWSHVKRARGTNTAMLLNMTILTKAMMMGMATSIHSHAAYPRKPTDKKMRVDMR